MATRVYPNGWKEFRARYLNILKGHFLQFDLNNIYYKKKSKNPYNTAAILNRIGTHNANRRIPGTFENKLTTMILTDYAKFIVDIFREQVQLELTYEIKTKTRLPEIYFYLEDKSLEKQIFEKYESIGIKPKLHIFARCCFATSRKIYRPHFYLLYATRLNFNGKVGYTCELPFRPVIEEYKAIVNAYQNTMLRLNNMIENKG